MQEIQPQINRIREKFKNDVQKMQQHTMELYRQHNVNPVGGCLPVFVQVPILYALYEAISYNCYIGQSGFLYMKLGACDPYYVLPLLAAFLTYVQTIVAGSNSNQSSQMKMMSWAMPVMIFVFALNAPAAISLYWIYGAIFTILQSVLITKFKQVNPS